MLPVTVEQLLDDPEGWLGLSVIGTRRGLRRRIASPNVQKTGLGLSGYTEAINPQHVQILGESEINFLNSLHATKRAAVIETICGLEIACFIVTHALAPPKRLREKAAGQRIPLLQTPLSTAAFITRITTFLEDRFAETTTVHGVLVDVLGMGIMIMGVSGIGKSECALDLISRGHRLVADDVVVLKKTGAGRIIGSSREMTRDHMEVRGLGIINVKELFGIPSVRDRKEINLIAQLREWVPGEREERTGLEESSYEILGVLVPLCRIPVRPGRTLATIIEVAARNQLLKIKGIDSARQIQSRLIETMARSRRGARRRRRRA